jgi:ABC-2 type transport system ATP-binding protein
LRRSRRIRVAGKGITPIVWGRVPSTVPAVQARGLVKRYGDRLALRGIDLSVEAGERVAVIGPNGAGKTTLLSILAGIVRADGGEVRSPHGNVGWVPQQAALYRRLTVEENLLLFARLEGHEDPRGSVEEMLELTGLRERRGEIVARLSGGNQQRINIAIGLLSRPVALLLDEPSVGLDPRQRARLWSFVSSLAARGTTVIFSTHDIQEAERYGQRLLVLADGDGLFDGTAEELRAAVRSEAPEAASSDFETAFVAFLQHRGH